MTRDGYRPPDLIPPALRARALWLVELAAIVGFAAAIVAAVVSLFR